MKKALFLLALIAFTFNVKAADWDFTIAEGEAVDVERAIAVQFNVNTNLWDYILKGNTLRVYIHHLQDDTRTNIPYHSYRINYHLNERNDVYGHYWIYTYSLTDNSFTGSAQGIYNRLIADMERTYNVKEPGPYSSPQAASNGTDIAIDIIDSNDIIIDEDENGEYLRFSDDDNLNGVGKVYFSDDSPTRLSKVAKSLTAASMKTALLGSASIPLNDVRITITNEAGQATSQFDTNIVVKLDQILQKVTRIQNDTSTMVNELMFLLNAFGYDGTPGSTTGSLAEFLGQWRTADGVWQGEILDSITNSVDYIDYWKKFSSYQDPTNVTSLVWLLNKWASYPGSIQSGLISRNQLNSWLGRDFYDGYRNYLRDQYSSFLSSDSSQMNYLISYLPRYEYLLEGIEYTKWTGQTNIIDSVSLGRDWLNLATNDISSLPYWLNQQATGGNLLPGQTNSLNDSAYRFNLLTNQYAQISLTGSNPSNTAETWNYFKRLEMLLAAIVYKQTDLSKIGEADDDNGTELANDTSVSAAVSSAEQDVSTSLSTVASSLSLTGLESSKNNLVSLWQIAVGAFDTPGSKPQITIFEQDEVGGDNNSSGAVNLDFSQGAIGDFCDFCHHLFGFLWSFGSLFIFWKVAKYCWDMGYRVVRFHYSLCRKFLGI